MIILELLAYITRTFSLGLRLAVNMITGHILAKVIVGFIYVAYLKGTSLLVLSLPLLLLTLFLGLEILIAYLQAYIFTFITCITFKDMAKSSSLNDLTINRSIFDKIIELMLLFHFMLNLTCLLRLSSSTLLVFHFSNRFCAILVLLLRN